MASPTTNTFEEKRAKLVGIESKLRRIETELQRLLAQQEVLIVERNSLRAELSTAPTISSGINTATPVSAARESLEKNDFPWSTKLMRVLKEVFNLDELRPFQLPTMNALLNRQDSILIMPTGGGKSLCFQLPALLVDGVTLVVSPLISLIEDQVMALKARGIEAEMLSASVSLKDQRNIIKDMVDKYAKMKILYVTPERIKKSKIFMTSLEKMYATGRLSHFVVDEVHCCSQWGHDFRPDYKVLGIIKGQFPEVPILGLTATATTAVLQDVRKMLEIENCLVFRASFNRPNLAYKVMAKPSSSKETVAELTRLLRTKYVDQSGIIYCLSVKESDDLARELVVQGIAACSYHASLAPEERSRVHRDWLANRCRIVVATIAFGMGIDKPDVRFVIHHSISKSMENYYQESGRAGRDGKQADCVTFFRIADIFRLSTMVFQDKTGLTNLYNSVEFCVELKRCRRAVLADHFGERWESLDCNKMCDNCNELLAEGGSAARTTVSTDVTAHCVTLLNIIEKAAKVKKPITALQLIDAWFGSRRGAAHLRSSQEQVPIFSRIECERIFANLLIQNYLKEKFHFTAYNTVSYIINGSRASLVSSGMTKITMDVVMMANKACKRVASSSGVTAATTTNDTNNSGWLKKSNKSSNTTTAVLAKEKSVPNKKRPAMVHDNDDDFEEQLDFAEWSQSHTQSAPSKVTPVPAATASSSRTDWHFPSQEIVLSDSSPEPPDANDNTRIEDIDWDEDFFSSSSPLKAASNASATKDAMPASTHTKGVETSVVNQLKQDGKVSLEKYMFTTIKRDAPKNNPSAVTKRLKL